MTTEAPFKSIRTSRMSLEIVKQIQESIFRGDFVAGQRLPIERELVQTFGVSKVTVREALRILETYGLIEIRPGAAGGAFVKEMTSHPVSRAAYNMLQLEGFRSAEVYAARLLFEPPVTELACRSATEDDLRELEESVRTTKDLVAENQKTIDESRQFHLMIARATHNPVIQLMVGSVLDLVKLCGAHMPSTPEMSRMILQEHEAIVEAMRQRDGARAQALMAVHLSDLAREFALLEEKRMASATDTYCA
ncbi:MAG: FadR family transcriptional regulator [Chloroflexi bacterium]|nr:FadR family transcriptional regulator [Chloroflexota bacterium]MDA8186562.1 FadR/GntR family transcriptional regulator [Dehalococcoidales bacterium]